MSRSLHVTRYEFLKAGVGLFTGLVAWPTSGASQQPLKLDVPVGEEESQQVMAILQQAGAQKVEALPQRGLAVVPIVIVAVIAVTALANVIIKLLPLWKCGVIIDTRGSRVRTEKNCDLAPGTVVIVSANEKVKLDRPSEMQIQTALTKLLK